MPHLLISAAHKSSGKTTLSIGLCAALTQQGYSVQAFKKGPDYIDPLWLSQAAQRPCYNLDFHTMSTPELVRTVARYGQSADVSLIEGNKGLFDGVAMDGSNSNAALANLLGAPVILVLDTRGMTRGIAPLLLGYQAFDRQLALAGVILNQVGGARHEQKLRAAISQYTDLPVLGAVQHDAALNIDERHLGLIPSNEADSAQRTIEQIAHAVREQVDIAACLHIAQQAPCLLPTATPAQTDSGWPPLRIGVMQDAAFGFYYASDLEALQRNGAELVFINALSDQDLPDIDGLFIGGGFPEMHAAALSRNHALRTALRLAIENDLPVYAECGGLMYLGRSLHTQGQSFPMVGALPYDTVMEAKPQGRGYVQVQETAQHLWGMGETVLAAHEFHYSRVVNLDSNLPFAYRVLRGAGIINGYDGLIYHNTLASYTHLRDVDNNHWTSRFLNFVRQQQRLPQIAALSAIRNHYV